MNNTKEKTKINIETYNFNVADSDYYYNSDDENNIVKEYIFKKAIIASIFLSAAVAIFFIL